MTTTLANGAASVVPLEVLGYSSTRTARNVVHEILGRSAPAVTFRAAGLRSGTLSLLVATLADALAAEQLHAAAGICHLTDDGLPLLNMNYVASGELAITLDDESRKLWTVEIPFFEVG